MRSWLRAGWLDLSRGVVGRREGEVRLTARESALLRYLAERAERTVSQEELLERVWGYAPGVASRTVEVTVHQVRRKIEVDPTAPDHLQTVRGEGYRFVPSRLADDDDALDPDARCRAVLLRAEAVGYDDPAAALALLERLPEVGPAAPEVAERAAEHLAALGRLDDAVAALDRAGRLGADPHRIALLRGMLDARRRDARAEARLREALGGTREIAIRARTRLGVWLLDGGRLDGWDELRRAAEDAVTARAHRLEALARGELGLYAILRGEPSLAIGHLGAALDASARARAGYAERGSRFGLATALRLAGDDAEADRQRRAAESLPVPRWEEPGLFAFRAIEARLAGRDAEDLVRAGLARDAERPYPADRAMLLALAGDPRSRDALLSDGPAYVAALAGHAPPLADQRLLPALREAFGGG